MSDNGPESLTLRHLRALDERLARVEDALTRLELLAYLRRITRPPKSHKINLERYFPGLRGWEVTVIKVTRSTPSFHGVSRRRSLCASREL
jgi:hypothetical protein